MSEQRIMYGGRCIKSKKISQKEAEENQETIQMVAILVLLRSITYRKLTVQYISPNVQLYCIQKDNIWRCFIKITRKLWDGFFVVDK